MKMTRLLLASVTAIAVQPTQGAPVLRTLASHSSSAAARSRFGTSAHDKLAHTHPSDAAEDAIDETLFARGADKIADAGEGLVDAIGALAHGDHSPANDAPSGLKSTTRSWKQVLTNFKTEHAIPDPLDPIHLPASTSTRVDFNRAVQRPFGHEAAIKYLHPQSNAFTISSHHLGLREEATLRALLNVLRREKKNLQTLLNMQALALARFDSVPASAEEIHAMLTQQRPLWKQRTRKLEDLSDKIEQIQYKSGNSRLPKRSV